jgi:hypothetical protein
VEIRELNSLKKKENGKVEVTIDPKKYIHHNSNNKNIEDMKKSDRKSSFMFIIYLLFIFVFFDFFFFKL